MFGGGTNAKLLFAVRCTAESSCIDCVYAKKIQELCGTLRKSMVARVTMAKLDNNAREQVIHSQS